MREWLSLWLGFGSITVVVLSSIEIPVLFDEKAIKLEILKASSRLSDLLEGLTGLRKIITLIVMVDDTKRIRIRISKGKRHMG